MNRITPAYAGKSRLHRRSSANPEDHPRLCGEKATQIKDSLKNYRITPAYAGKSVDGNEVRDRLGGSPPPMRGKGQIDGEFFHR